MEILGLVASPRKNGNTDILMQKALAGAAATGANTNIIYLNDLKMKGCQACLDCKKTGHCIVKDDMQNIYQAIDKASAIIIGSPVYFGRFTAQLALAMDRMYAYIRPDRSSSLKKGKKFALIFTQGNPDPTGYKECVQNLSNVLNRLGFEPGSQTLIGADLHDAADAANNEMYLQQAFLLGKDLTNNQSD